MGVSELNVRVREEGVWGGLLARAWLETLTLSTSLLSLRSCVFSGEQGPASKSKVVRRTKDT